MQRSHRWAYLYLPRQRVERAVQRQPELAGQPFGEWEEAGQRLVLAACSPEAVALGARRGMSLAEARALVPGLAVVQRDAEDEAAVFNRLAEEALALSPTLSPDPPRGLFADVGQTAHLFGGEAGFAAALIKLAGRHGFSARVALAGGARIARLVAMHRREATACIPSGKDARAVAPIPLTSMALGPEMRERLRLLGLGTLGELARLPVGTLPRRFGPAGLTLHRLARGEDGLALPAFSPHASIREALVLEGPLETLDTLSFVLKQLLDRVESRLRQRGAATTRLVLTLGQEDCSPLALPVHFAHPFRAARSLLAICRARLQDVQLEAPVLSVEVEVLEEAPFREPTEDLFRRALAGAEGLAELLARLEAALGEGAVFGVRPVEVHRPEGAWEKVEYGRAQPPTRVPADEGAGPPRTPRPEENIIRPSARLAPRASGLIGGLSSAPQAPIRLLSPPEPAELLPPDGAARALAWRERHWRVRRLEGPRRYQAEWWQGSPLARDYYVLDVEDGDRLWLYREPDGRVFVQGWFD
jgi:protein ImuB